MGRHSRETPLQLRLREETALLPQGQMQIGPDQAAFFALLVRALGVHRALEIGTFTGYSSLAVASALPADGRLVCCDISAEWTAVAGRYWREAGVDTRIDLHLGPAAETLTTLLAEGNAGSFDFAFYAVPVGLAAWWGGRRPRWCGADASGCRWTRDLGANRA